MVNDDDEWLLYQMTLSVRREYVNDVPMLNQFKITDYRSRSLMFRLSLYIRYQNADLHSNR